MRRTVLSAGVTALLAAAAVGFAAPAQALVQVPVAQVRSNEWWLSALGIEKAWPAAKYGAGVKIGVLDSGVDEQNQDLQRALVAGKDFSGEGSPDGRAPVKSTAVLTSPYHGTTMATLIAGRGHGPNNSLGMIGVAPKASLISASTASGNGSFAPQYGKALRYLVDQGAKVINMSFGGVDVASEIAYAQAHDVVLIGGAGNDAGPPNMPANVMGVVDVAGIDKNLQPDPMSSRGGPTISGGDSLPPSESANGVAVVGPYADEPGEGSDLQGDGYNTNGIVASAGAKIYARASGTSNATAIVSGIVALIRAAHPEMNAANVINQLGQTAQHPGKTGSNYSGELGFGVPNAYNAVTKVLPSVCENPLGSVAEPQSFGLWKAIKTNTSYQPKCPTTPSASPSGSGSTPATSSSSSNQAIPPVSNDSGSSSGVPVWVWPVVAVVVLGAVALIVASRRSRRTASPGVPPGAQPPPSN